MDDLDMDAAAAGDVDRLLDRFDDLVRFVADMGEIGGVVALDDLAQRDDLGALGIAAGRREQPGREPERPRREPLVEQRRHLRELGRARRPRRHAHHVEPQGVMADQHAGIDRDRRKGIEIFGKADLAERQPRRAGGEIIADQLEPAAAAPAPPKTRNGR